MISIIDTLDYFKEIYKIELQNLPNQNFDVYIENQLFNLQIRTYDSGRSTITIFKGNDVLCEEAPFLINMNLCFYSSIEDYAFFFLTSRQLESYNFSNLGSEINLYYGSI